MKRMLRWFLVSVLVVDVAVMTAMLSGALQPVEAKEAVTPAVAEAAAPVAPSAEALALLGAELARRDEELKRREADLDELLRGPEVLERAGLAAPSASTSQPSDPIALALPGSTEAAASPPPDETAVAAARAFDNLSRAYENMDPTSAARALAELAAMDEEAALELLKAWKPRTSGAILDALTQTDAMLAAHLSYRVWKGTGKISPEEASDGR